MMLQGHGGNVSAIACQFGVRTSEIIDMSSNINPLGPPEGLMNFLKANLMSLTVLPEVDSKQTSTEFACYMDIAPDRVLAGNGTTQFIYVLPRILKSKNAIILGPTYSDYNDACTQHGIKVCHHFADDTMDFDHNIGRLESQLEGIDTVFICNPNNPTGRSLPMKELQNLCRAHLQTTFIIDESYLPFMIEAENESMLNSGLDNVIVLASLSKIFKIPGLRIGFMIASPETVKKFHHMLLPWSVNSLAQAAVHYLNRNKDRTNAFVQKSRLFFEDQRQQFYQHLKEISGLKAYPSRAPYVLIQIPATISSKEIWVQFAKEKILIRDCSNFMGLTEQYIRISLKQPDINRMFVEKLGSMIEDIFKS